jgi:hypothetical protein
VFRGLFTDRFERAHDTIVSWFTTKDTKHTENFSFA